MRSVHDNNVYDGTSHLVHCYYCCCRAIASNRLATSGNTWVETFSRYHSGTYSNQWMVIDFNRYGAACVRMLLRVYAFIPSTPCGLRTERSRFLTSSHVVLFSALTVGAMLT
jgi:N-glycosylase/DNA lyase